MKQVIHDIALDMIDDPQVAMRTQMNQENLEELAKSIRNTGLIQPITLRQVNERYEVVAGHRRLCAAKLAGMITISAVIHVLDDEKADDIKIQENLFREDINPVDEARFIAGLVEKYDYSPEDLSKKVNKSIAYLMARYALLQYPDYLVLEVEKGTIGLGAAGWLVKITDENTRREYTHFAAGGGITSKRAEAWYRSWQAGALPTQAADYVAPEQGEGVEAQPLLMPCVFCTKHGDISVMAVHYVHQDCIAVIKQAHSQDTTPAQAGVEGGAD